MINLVNTAETISAVRGTDIPFSIGIKDEAGDPVPTTGWQIHAWAINKSTGNVIQDNTIGDGIGATGGYPQWNWTILKAGTLDIPVGCSGISYQINTVNPDGLEIEYVKGEIQLTAQVPT